MDYSRVFTVATYSEVFGKSVKVNYLNSALTNFDLLEILGALSRSNLLIFDYKKYISNQSLLIRNFFDDKTLKKIQDLAKKIKNDDIHFGKKLLIFNRVQLLYLFQKSFLLCTKDKNKRKLDLKRDRIKLGQIFLMVNDFVYKAEKKDIDNLTDKEKKEFFLLYFLKRYENNNIPHLKHEVVRNKIVFKDIINQDDIKSEFFRLGIEECFLEENKVDLAEYIEFVFGIIALFIERLKNPNSFITNPSSSSINKKIFSKTNIKSLKVKNFLKSLALEIEKFANKIEEDMNKFPSNAFISFRQFPIVKINQDYFCIDLGFLIEKIGRNIFWQINNSLPKKNRDKFHIFWGSVFERYVDSIFERIYNPSSSLSNFYPHPSPSNNNKELIDGIIDYYDSVIILEYKSSFLPLHVKFSEDIRAFEQEVKNKLKIKKLAKTIRKMFIEKSLTCEKIDVKKVKKIFSIIVTLEPCYKSELSNWFINEIFNKYKPSNKGLLIFPLQVITMEELEYLEPFLSEGLKFIDILKERLDFDKNLIRPFSDYINLKLSSRVKKSNKFIDREYEKWFTQMKEMFFGKKERQT